MNKILKALDFLRPLGWSRSSVKQAFGKQKNNRSIHKELPKRYKEKKRRKKKIEKESRRRNRRT